MPDSINTMPRSIIRETTTSVLVAVAFLFNSICLLANIILPSITNFGESLIIIILFMGMIICFWGIRLNKHSLVLNFSLLLVVVISYLYYDLSPIVYPLLMNFIAWGIGITIIMMQNYSLRLTLNISFILATITLFFELITNANLLYESMTWTYAVFPCLVAVVAHFMYCRFRSWKMKLLYVPGLIVLFKYLSIANRGGMVSFIILIYLISIKVLNSKDRKLRNKKLLNLLLLLFAICGILFYDTIVTFAYKLSLDWDINISALTKMYRMIKSYNITNNRSELYAYAWRGFLQSPVWGNGVGGFSINHGGWTHNFILQILYEGGILLFMMIIIPLIKIILFFIKGNHVNSDEYAMFIMLFCTSVPKLLFSTELWNTQGFWMLLVFGMITSSKRLVESKDSNEYIIDRRKI